MLAKEINFISDFNLNKIKKLGSFFTFERFSASEIHPAIVQYVSAHLNFLIFEDRRKLLLQSMFDYSGPEIARYFNLISEEVKKNKRLSYEDMRTLVLQAVTFNANFLIRPKWSLSKLIFEDSESKSIDEIRYVLNYTYYYDFIKSIMGAYLKKRKLIEITREDFEEVFDKIDNEITSTQPKQFIENALFSLSDFFGIGGVSKTKVPLTAIETFLKDKNLTDYIFRLKRALPAEPKTNYETEELRNILLTEKPFGQILKGVAPDEIIHEEQEPVAAEPVTEEEDKLPEQEPETETEEQLSEADEIVAGDAAEEVMQPKNADESEAFKDEAESALLTATPGFAEALRAAEDAEPNVNAPVLDDMQKVEEFLLASNEETVNDIIDYIASTGKLEEDGQPEEKEKPAEDEKPQEQEELFQLEEPEDEDDFEEIVEEIKSETDEMHSGEASVEEPLPGSAEETKIEEAINGKEENTADIVENAEEETPEAPVIAEHKEQIITLLDEIEGRNSLSDITGKTIELEDEPEEKTITDEQELSLFAEPEPLLSFNVRKGDEEELADFGDEKIMPDNPVSEEPVDKPDFMQGAELLLEPEKPALIQQDEAPEKDITAYFSEKDAAKITSSVFKKDNVEFIIALGKISKCKNFEEASAILNNVFVTNRVEPFSREAAKLTKIIEEYFNF